jgi:hypothetical protein
MTDHSEAEAPAPINVLLGKPTLLARVVAFVGSVDTRVLGTCCGGGERRMMPGGY